ncbi:uncharacterized protein FOMMEDRAFT_142828 [Fomitiporia mediterranea MF3/22]|uniref:uncharacterized protein n=1 Tax=Fomitiporia mediterranea (strain MF3/22) TaxID=694068 RepID=UPI0004408DD7|nr:uncharacterized protein FOMMEDRAFT_142828 [Fomitiporia mediterranea MF3/22]EJC99214.1 hypothetical protein FOMMEDRAFT_142828 [Fomitiporia mediterranea MF3/22]
MTRLAAGTSLPITSTTTRSNMSSHDNCLHARNSGGSNSSAGAQSLTFGFAFMAILLCLLAFAHGMQRYANRRQRAELERLGALGDVQEGECIPKIWDVHLTANGSAFDNGSRNEEASVKKGKECAEVTDLGDSVFREEDGRIRWNDIQPLSAARVLPTNSLSTSISKQSSTLASHSNSASTPAAEPHDHDRDRDRDRPLQVAMIISMPVPPRYVHNSRRDSEKTAVSSLPHESENDWSGQAYYELGVMTVR